LLTEIMGNNLRTKEAVALGEGEHRNFYEIIEASSQFGWMTFDQSILNAYQNDLISEETTRLYATRKGTVARGIDLIQKTRGVDGELESGLRCDKLILTALQTAVDLYLDGKSGELPVLAILKITTDQLRVRADALLAQIRGLPLLSAIGEGKSQVGGGSLPRAVIPSVTLDLLPTKISLDDFTMRLRQCSPPVVGYIAGGKFKLDLRTIFSQQDAHLLSALRSAAQWS